MGLGSPLASTAGLGRAVPPSGSILLFGIRAESGQNSGKKSAFPGRRLGTGVSPFLAFVMSSLSPISGEIRILLSGIHDADDAGHAAIELVRGQECELIADFHLGRRSG